MKTRNTKKLSRKVIRQLERLLLTKSDIANMLFYRLKYGMITYAPELNSYSKQAEAIMALPDFPLPFNKKPLRWAENEVMTWFCRNEIPYPDFEYPEIVALVDRQAAS